MYGEVIQYHKTLSDQLGNIGYLVNNVNQAYTKFINARIEIRQVVDTISLQMVEQIYMMAYRKLEQSLVAAEIFERTVYPDYDQQYTNTKKYIADCLNIIIAHNPSLKSYGILESLTNKYTITTKLPLQFNIIKQNMNRLNQTDQQLVQPLMQNVINITNNTSHEQYILYNEIDMTKIRLCPLIYKIIDYFDDYVDEDVDNTIFTADLNDLDNQDHIDNLAEC